ncbi:uncharacterized protein BCR38DRAFT_486875 [Pseudomassariella vexata]|uniref:Copper-fist domain-containing protein n=1 Tax=Pseudomassariella vexata TaxID=1141098 RepID=A0A1Y2DTN0_9PEZI|nr:uncharacterized protein BCR38DRAFT_486875 [Pseudomassariella vexata]ORY62610.1 hypothetical protein BCR38DRAFT_486875 [Pseudomassariella vexata]
MIIDGEKWACEACVRGHRVSNCQHSDRPLQHINKKGRPVSQCQHCRAMRKSRASHVKCDCGEKTHKCQHLQQTVDGHRESCCCNHGGRCTCSHKKEPSLDTVPESETDEEELRPSKSKVTIRRRRTNTAISEPVLSFDENGHHKPMHKHNKVSQKCGPYSLSRGSSMHSSSSSSSLGNRSMDNLLHGKTSGRLRAKDTAALSEEDVQRSKSEQASPSVGGSSFQQLNSNLPPLDLSTISSQYPDYQPGGYDFGGLSDCEQPIYSAGLSAVSVDWAQYDGLELNGDSFEPSSFGQAQSYTGFDLGSTEPTLTSNSGDVSETEDFVPVFSEAQMEGFRNSAATNFLNSSQTQTSMLGGSDLGNVDFAQFKGTAAANKFLPNLGGLDDFPLLEEDNYWSMNNNFADGLTNSPDPIASAFWDTQ